MDYEKTIWTITMPINKTKLNKMEEGIFQAHRNSAYSTEEQLIGTWLGKKLYRKVYTFTITTGYENYTPIASVSDIEQVVNIEGFCMLGGKDWRKIGCSEYPDSSEITRFLATKNDDGSWNIGFQNVVMTEDMEVCAIVEYTKTTD